MQKKGALLLLIPLILVIIIAIVWEDEEPVTVPIPVENTTEVITQTDTTSQEEERFKLDQKQDDLPVKDTKEETPVETTDISIPEKMTETFKLVNTKAQDYQVTLTDEKITLLQNDKPIILINLFATWCPPCIAQVAYLNDLQKKHEKELFIAGILTHDKLDTPSLETFMTQQQVNYFISDSEENDLFANFLAQRLHLDQNFSIPLTVMYVDGNYFTHYEGSVPVEMIEYDIQQAKKQLKSR